MPRATAIELHRGSKLLEVRFDSGETFHLPCEYLRVHSPSAEVQGHGPGQRVLQFGKQGVNIRAIHPIGHYAVQLAFDDGHDSGLFSWDTLYDLGRNQASYWQQYLNDLAAAGKSRAG
ncbi:MAG: gamma-butyrobetaine hydroxylase-like domain-containing protein [Lysobacterales bacterium]